MATGTLFITPIQLALDTNDDPVSGAKAYLAEQRSGQRLFAVPAQQQPTLHGSWLESQLNFPLAHAQRAAVVLYHLVRAAVIRLNGFGGPSAVLRTIRRVYVDSVQRMLWRAWTHVGQEVRKRIAPAVAHGNASTAIILEQRYFLVVAPRLRAIPRTVGRRIALSMTIMRSSSRISGQTTAALSGPASKAMAKHYSCFSALAATFPTCALRIKALVSCTTKNKQATESATSHVLALITHKTIIRHKVKDFAPNGVTS